MPTPWPKPAPLIVKVVLAADAGAAAANREIRAARRILGIRFDERI
jgi:hypothetical protein